MRIAKFILVALVAFFVVLAPTLVSSDWDTYGPWFVRGVAGLARQIAPSQRIMTVGTVAFTPTAEVTVGISCDGFAGMRTFSLLFGLILLLTWRRMDAWKFIAMYLAAIAILWIHNAARIVSAIVQGGETHYGSRAIMIVLLAGGLALAAFRRFGDASAAAK